MLLVGFAYVWRRGDLDWVRALSRERSTVVAPQPAKIWEEPTTVAMRKFALTTRKPRRTA